MFCLRNKMMVKNDEKLTKSDFLLYCEAPRHLWAKRNGEIEQDLSDFTQHLISEGYEVEKLAQDFFINNVLIHKPGFQISFQQTFSDGPFEARTDALIYIPATHTYELYEIKSSTSLDKTDLYDVTYQFLILQKKVKIERVFITHLNKEYIRDGDLDLAQLFVVEDVTEKVQALLPEIDSLRQKAYSTFECKDSNVLENCLSPKDCPCLEICHPNLPEFSIFDIPRLSQRKKSELLVMGIREAKDIPLAFSLNEKQQLIAERAKTNSEYIDRVSLRKELEGFQFPLWFLDYETCISAIPRFNKYHPQQQIVFQYSLHKLENLDGKLEHKGYIAVSDDDPSSLLLEHLKSDLGPTGTVIVWNKAFEMTMNKEMAKLYPDYESFLLDLNSRIYDLGEIVNQGIYIHPLFKGSWSIKHVLPVMVPELSYESMSINKGDKASMAWWTITFGKLSDNEKKGILCNLDQYCELDTLAMVEIYKRFLTFL